MSHRRRIVLVFGLLVLFGLGISPMPTAYAVPAFVVTTTADTDDGTCDTNCTLREAINATNANTGNDTISFSVSGTITLGSALPALDDNLTIDGTGQTITVSGNNL